MRRDDRRQSTRCIEGELKKRPQDRSRGRRPGLKLHHERDTLPASRLSATKGPSFLFGIAFDVRVETGTRTVPYPHPDDGVALAVRRAINDGASVFRFRMAA